MKKDAKILDIASKYKLYLPVSPSFQMEYENAFVKEDGDTLVVGYLADSDYAENPLEVSECYGALILKDDSDFNRYIGVDANGDYHEHNISNHELKMLWPKKAAADWLYTEFVMANSSEFSRFGVSKEDKVPDKHYFQRCALANLDTYTVNGTELYQFASYRKAYCQIGRQNLENCPDTEFSIPVYISSQSGCTQILAEPLFEPDKKYASYDAVWIPGIKDNIDVIKQRAKLYRFGEIVRVSAGLKYTYQVLMNKGIEGIGCSDHETWLDAYEWLENHIASCGIMAYRGSNPRRVGVVRAAHEMAKQSLQLYSEYVNGNIYSTVIAQYKNIGTITNPNWDFVNEDRCGGYVGSEDALMRLSDDFTDYALSLF